MAVETQLFGMGESKTDTVISCESRGRVCGSFLFCSCNCSAGLRWKLKDESKGGWLEPPFVGRGSLAGDCSSEWPVELLWLQSPQCQGFQAFASWGQWSEVISSLPPSWKRQSPVEESGAGRVGGWVGLTLYSFCSSQGPSVSSGKPILSSAVVTVLSGFLLSCGAGGDGRRPRGFGNLSVRWITFFSQCSFCFLPALL